MIDSTATFPQATVPGRMGVPGQGVWVGRCSDDPISGPAQKSFNDKIEALLRPCWQYIADLRTGGEQLVDVARRYGWTEEEIASHFRSAGR